MLLLSRKSGERVMIGHGITVMVTDISGSQVTLGISAPPDVPVLREELAKTVSKAMKD